VCAIQGWTEYEPIARDFGVPLVVTGFEPVDLLEGILMAVRQLEQGRAEVENQYVRAVGRAGNVAAQAVVAEVFETCDRAWRGIGVIARSGLQLREAYRDYDAELRFPRVGGVASESELCIAGQVLVGRAKPDECPAYGTLCTPEHPLGAPMVSSEGACAAYFLAGRTRQEVSP
jgi:hydrogenase expression/formation protein HypD